MDYPILVHKIHGYVCTYNAVYIFIVAYKYVVSNGNSNTVVNVNVQLHFMHWEYVRNETIRKNRKNKEDSYKSNHVLRAYKMVNRNFLSAYSFIYSQIITVFLTEQVMTITEHDTIVV